MAALRGRITEEFFKPLESLTGWTYSIDQIRFVDEEIGDLNPIEMQKLAKAVARKCSYKATLADILKVRGEKSEGVASAPGGSKLFKKWREQDEALYKAVKDYSASYMLNSPIAAQARAEGWEGALQEFVRHTANYMQQVIQGGNGYGWSSQAVPSRLVTAYRALLKECTQKIRETGAINVDLAMPDLAPQYWREAADQRNGQKQLIVNQEFLDYVDQLAE